MDDLRPDDVAARVVAWHNRHPLARRITAAQVQSIGSVALPFVAQNGAVLPAELASRSEAVEPVSPRAPRTSLRERLLARAPLPAGAAEDPGGATPAPHGGAPKAPGRWVSWTASVSRAFARLRRTRARARALRPVFSEDFIAPLSRRQVAAWALRHGAPLPDGAFQGPLRSVEADARLVRGATTSLTLRLTTAAIEQGSRRTRLLLAEDRAGGAIGPRLWSPARLASLVGVLALAGATGAWPWLPEPWKQIETPSLVSWFQRMRPHAETSASAATPVSAPAAAPSPVGDTHVADAQAAVDPHNAAVHPHEASPVQLAPHPRALPPDDAPPAPDDAPPAHARVASAPTSPDTAVPPPAAVGQSNRVALPLRPMLDDDAKAEARRTVAELRAARGLPAPHEPAAAAATAAVATAAVATPAIAAAPVPAVAAPVALATPAPALAPPPGTPVFALTTRTLRTRAESEQFLLALRALLKAQPQAADRPALRVELMEAGEDWRVVCWPFTRRDDAERARALLATRGLRVQTVDF